MRKWLAVIFSFVASVAIVLGLRFYDNQTETQAYTNQSSLIKQDVLNFTKTPVVQHKLYHNDQLIGVVHDVDKLYANIAEQYHLQYEAKFPNTELTLGADVYLTDEKAYYETADVDQQIFQYLKDEELLGLKTTSIEFSTRDGVYDIIYIDDINKFYTARDRFLLNFISEESLNELRNGIDQEPLTEINSTNDIGMRIAETITTKPAVAKPSEIFTDVSQIYEFLCYGRNKERQYYVVKQGDTLQGVGYNYGNLSPQQIMMLNPDKIINVDQVLTVGMSLNVTYFSSPINVYITKERLAEENILPDPPLQQEDPNMYSNETKIITHEENGLKNVLYEEVWINGVRQSGVARSEVIIRQPIQGVIAVGTKQIPNIGTGNFAWPVKNPIKTCGWYCYYGHEGLDIQNMYNHWDYVYAADNGTVVDVSYDDIGGNHITIDHNNGYQTYYGHLSAPAYPEVGETVMRGQLIGPIGMTGYATGPHVHFAIYQNGTLVDPCTIVNCNSIP